jgi:hypothetical protein
MEAGTTLRVITFASLAISFVTGIISQLWKSTEDVEGKRTKRLTPAGWVLLGIAAVSFAGSVTAELIRQRMNTDQASESKTEALAAQPLTSLNLHWGFVSDNPSLQATMNDGQKQIQQNAEGEQGGVPETPYETEDYFAGVLPLFTYVARIGDNRRSRTNTHVEDPPKGSLVTLMPLDDASNVILSFGIVADGVKWHDEKGEAALSSGFFPVARGTRQAESWPKVTVGAGSYALDWDIDPETLANATDRLNQAIAPTGKLPKVMNLALLRGAGELPFQRNNFGKSFAVTLWRENEWAREYVPFTPELKGSTIRIAVNGVNDSTFEYTLNRVYKLRLTDNVDDDFDDVGCTILEFQAH